MNFASSIVKLTFFSDSFPFIAKGGGIKDGTYLQGNVSINYQCKNPFHSNKENKKIIRFNIHKSFPLNLVLKDTSNLKLLEFSMGNPANSTIT